jgi:CO dehydrogenase maturation factor
MGVLVAFSGKGGSGKTTLAAMVLRQLVRAAVKPILAVDADPNSTLALTLGVPVEGTISDLRDRMGQAAKEVSEIPKERLMNQWLAEVLTEASGFDLLTMGRPEGPQCYCYVNGLLRRYLKELRGAYPAVVVDCEAGMEYLSRLTVDDVDVLVLVAEATSVGLTTARRLAALANALPIRVRRRVLVLNKVGLREASDELPEDLAVAGVGDVVRVPFDEDLHRRCTQGVPLDDQAGPAAQAAVAALARLCLPQIGTGVFAENAENAKNVKK